MSWGISSCHILRTNPTILYSLSSCPFRATRNSKMGVENKKIITKSCEKRMKNMIVLVPYPAQGHVTPMVKLGRAFHTHGFQPVLITPESIHAQLCKNHNDVVNDSVVYKSVPDSRLGKQSDFFGIEKVMEDEMPLHLDRIICQLEEESEESKVVCLVVDLVASWAIPVGTRKGILVAGFWPAMLATYRFLSAIPEMVQSGLISQSGIPIKEGATCSLPDQPRISTQDLPWMIGDVCSKRGRFQFWNRTLQRSSLLSYLLVNSFDGEEACCWEKGHQGAINIKNCQQDTILECKITAVLPVGALNMQQALVDTTPSFWKEDTDCLNWLDKQKSSSVLYISFGSWVSPIGEANIKSLATALEATAQPFLWVLGSAWRQGLPEGFVHRVSKRGKLVFWAPQKEVLEHKAVGCYLSHCGWNSTMEAILFQKKLLCYPLAGDQFINCKYIMDVWRIGTRMCNLELKDLEEGMQITMGNKEMSTRLADLKEKFMGEKAISGAMDNLTSFISYMQNVYNKSHLSM